MNEDYLSRYMDLSRCEEINKNTACPLCGHPLKARHRTDLHRQHVKEMIRCPFCRKYSASTEYQLQ